MTILLLVLASTITAQHKRSAILDWGEFQSIGNQSSKVGEVIFAVGKLTVPRHGNVKLVGTAGVLEAGGDRDLKIYGAGVVGRTISFGTRERDGISYRFSGKFNENYMTDAHGVPTGVILAGTLVKLDQGKELLRTSVKFHFQFYSD